MASERTSVVGHDGITHLAPATGHSGDMSAAEWAARLELAACYRAIDIFGWSALTGNHISLRVPGENDCFLINEFGLTYREVTASNLVKVDSDGRLVGDVARPVNYAGFLIHSAVHGARADAHCVLHTHTIEDNAVSALEEGLLSLNQQSAMFAGQVAYHDYEGPALNPDEQLRLQADLGDKPLLMLRNHGMLAAGRSVSEAFLLTYHFQIACRMQIATLSCGRPFRIVAGDAERAAAELFTRFRKTSPNPSWEAVRRRVDIEQPDYRI